MIHFTSVSAAHNNGNVDNVQCMVTYLSPHRQTDSGWQRPVLPGGHPSSLNGQSLANAIWTAGKIDYVYIIINNNIMLTNKWIASCSIGLLYRTG